MTGKECSKGDEIIFDIAGGKILVSCVKGDGSGTNKGAAPYADVDISFALLDTYLGVAKPEVSPTLTASIKKAFA